MKKLVTISALALLIGVQAVSQNRFFTRTGVISFVASTALETIDPVNRSVSSVVDIGTGQMEFAVLIRGFEFRKALMQEHFNENFMESAKFPKATFKGKIQNLAAVNFKKDGTYPATASGILEIHGVQKNIVVPGTLTVSGQTLKITSRFSVPVSDYNIRIPGIVRDKIAKTAEISVNCSYNPLK